MLHASTCVHAHVLQKHSGTWTHSTTPLVVAHSNASVQVLQLTYYVDIFFKWRCSRIFLVLYGNCRSQRGTGGGHKDTLVESHWRSVEQLSMLWKCALMWPNLTQFSASGGTLEQIPGGCLWLWLNLLHKESFENSGMTTQPLLSSFKRRTEI